MRSVWIACKSDGQAVARFYVRYWADAIARKLGGYVTKEMEPITQ